MKVFYLAGHYLVGIGHVERPLDHWLECLELLLKGGGDVNCTTSYVEMLSPPITFVFDDLRSPDDIPMKLDMLKLLLTYGKNFFSFFTYS